MHSHALFRTPCTLFMKTPYHRVTADQGMYNTH